MEITQQCPNCNSQGEIMSKIKEKILKFISNSVEAGILTSQDAKKELINNLKY